MTRHKLQQQHHNANPYTVLNLKVSLIFKLFLRVIMTGWALLPVRERQIQVNLCESEANLAYMADSMLARAT